MDVLKIPQHKRTICKRRKGASAAKRKYIKVKAILEKDRC